MKHVFTNKSLENVIVSNKQMLADIQGMSHNLCLDYFDFFIFDSKFSFSFFKDLENICINEAEKQEKQNNETFFLASETFFSVLKETTKFLKICVKVFSLHIPEFQEKKLVKEYTGCKFPSYLLTIKMLKFLQATVDKNSDLPLNNAELFKKLAEKEKNLMVAYDGYICEKENFKDNCLDKHFVVDTVVAHLQEILSAGEVIFEEELQKAQKSIPLNKLLNKSIKTSDLDKI